MGKQLSLATVYERTDISVVPIGTLISLLADEVSLEKVADFASKIEAARKYDSGNTERRNYWGEAAIWSSRRLGELIRAAQEGKLVAEKGRPKKGHDAPLKLKDLGVSLDASKRSQRLVDVPAEKITAYTNATKASGDVISKAGLIRFATGTEKAGTAAHVSMNTGVPEWYTPVEYVDAARSAMGGIDLDPATSKQAQKTVKAKKFLTLTDDGLSVPWAGRVFLNPPYSSDLVGKFCQKLGDEYESGDVSQFVLLVNNATETAWFQKIARRSAAVCFPKGRIKFLDEDGSPGAPLQGQAVLYGGLQAPEFIKYFKHFGICFASWR